MKKIIHMSDLHIGYKDNAQRFHVVVKKIEKEKSDKASEYVIVITGDLIDNAHHRDSYKDVKIGLENLKIAGFKHILIVPGNHDYGTGDHGDKKFVKMFHEMFYRDGREFPRKDIIEDVAFIGLDSMAEELHWYDEIWAEGELGKKQLSCLNQILGQEDVRACKRRVVYLHHHPFDFRPLHQLKDSSKLKRVLTDNINKGTSIDAILYGHNHEGKAHNGKWGVPRCYDAGTATSKPRPRFVNWLPWFQIQSSIRTIDFEGKDSLL